VPRAELRRRLADAGLVAEDEHLRLGHRVRPTADRVSLRRRGLRIHERFRNREKTDHGDILFKNARSRR
jgi:hypothetical protein